MILFEIEPVSKSKLLNVEVYNNFFVKITKNYYAPVFYIPGVFSKLKNNSQLFSEFVVKGLREYYSNQLYNNILSVKYVNETQDSDVSDFLILKGLTGNRNDVVPSSVWEEFGKLNKYFDGVDTITYMFNQYKSRLPIVYGKLFDTKFHSYSLVLLKNMSQLGLISKIEEKMYSDLIVKHIDSLLVIDDGIAVEPELFKLTNNTAMFFVFPYLYIRGQLDYNTGIVNKYEFTVGKRRYFKLVDSRIVNGSFIIKSDKIGELKVKEFDSVNKAVNSINYFISKGLIEHHIIPLYNGDKTYLFVKARKGDWVSVLDAGRIRLTDDKKMCSKSMGGFVRVIVNNKFITSFYSPIVAGVINPDMNLSGNYGETCGQQVYEIKV